jgi:hypothetical protein
MLYVESVVVGQAWSSALVALPQTLQELAQQRALLCSHCHGHHVHRKWAHMRRPTSIAVVFFSSREGVAAYTCIACWELGEVCNAYWHFMS